MAVNAIQGSAQIQKTEQYQNVQQQQQVQQVPDKPKEAPAVKPQEQANKGKGLIDTFA